jgi:hypothetical protein
MELWQVAIVSKELIIHNFEICKEYSLVLSFFHYVIQYLYILLEVFVFLIQN